MYKRNGIYYLTFCAPGTEYSSYAMGAYKSKAPLEGFEMQRNNPFTMKKYGIVRGPGHGCVVDGPDNTMWVFYTCTMCYTHPLERRIGYDSAYIDENGDIAVREVTEIPQWAPGLKKTLILIIIPIYFRLPSV